MHTNIFAELSLVIVIAAIISVLLRLIRQPMIIGYILTGLVVGSLVTNFIGDGQTIEVFTSVGVALLLFIIGMSFNPKVIKEVGKVAGITGIIQIVLTSSVGFIVSRALGYGKTESLIIGMALAFSSTIIVLKLLNDKKEQTRLYGKVAIGILLIQNLAAIIALVFVSARSEGIFSPHELTFLAIKGLLVVIPMFLLSTYILPKTTKFIATNQELLFLCAIGWGFGIAALFEYLGYSIEVGALFAGIALANLPYVQEITSRLKPLHDFFVIVFFIAIGSKLELNSLGGLLLPVFIFVFVVIIFKPVLVTLTMGLLGYTKNTSFRTGTALAQISEFSIVLVILAHSQNLLRQEVVNVITVVALISIAISTYAITYSRTLYDLLEKKMIIYERRKLKSDNKSMTKYQMVLFGYNKGGQEFIKTMKQMDKKFVVVDYDPEIIDLIAKRNVHFMYGDATDLELLEEVNLSNTKLVVSTVGDHNINVFLAKWLNKHNQQAVFVCAADTALQASELYDEGVSYVMMPHYIGSEKISSFIKKNGLSKIEFKKFREKHLLYLQTHYQ